MIHRLLIVLLHIQLFILHIGTTEDLSGRSATTAAAAATTAASVTSLLTQTLKPNAALISSSSPSYSMSSSSFSSWSSSTSSSSTPQSTTSSASTSTSTDATDGYTVTNSMENEVVKLGSVIGGNPSSVITSVDSSTLTTSETSNSGVNATIEIFTTSTTTAETTPETGQEFSPAEEPRILTPFEEKMEALSCDLPLLPSDYRIWKGNETHELLLPIMVPAECPHYQTSSSTATAAAVISEKSDQGNYSTNTETATSSSTFNPTPAAILKTNTTITTTPLNGAGGAATETSSTSVFGNCPGGGGGGSGDTLPPHSHPQPPATAAAAVTLSWDGSIEIQSGDVLLVRIDDSHLVHHDGAIINQTNTSDQSLDRFVHEPTTAVYQVTRTGHDHCDITEGILLDITPLKVDNQKVVTLYDKDLTLGINLLIVVSEQWGNQCVRLKVTVKSDNCGENEDCSGKGVCYSNVSMDGYECQCCLGYVGQHCEEQDACYPSPCKNNGICVLISQGHEGSTFQCLCPYGYTGRTCDEPTNPCTSMPCQNGGTCTGNASQFKCECHAGYSGPLCQHSHNCDSAPCVHGICVDQEDGYKCFCQPGFTGTHCEYEYNECESSPCANGGTCTDHVDHFTCTCGRGFTGKMCQIKVDLCEPNLCPSPRFCVDHGNLYSCECPKGYTGNDCLIPTDKMCSNNPCNNGGTCWDNENSYYCACKPGYTGRVCEDEFVVEKITHAVVETKTDERAEWGGGGISQDAKTQQKFGGGSSGMIPISARTDRLHNAYIAGGTLGCAIIIVLMIVTFCYCRVHKTYKWFVMREHTFLWWQNRRGSQTSVSTNTEWFSGKDKAPTATPSRCLPSMEAADMYYTLDFSDSQCSPLIQ